eukprot:TRINITY_DN4270_c0_g1_i1.p2 TRINITY_DN4270_c0_g1~~TRINITY_DN4270_c0_g1_i1.p2  ORF type:complete len:340 (+),score=170.44 TRINITY_DN4270_c0_g1_i1:783-1802(+)
MLLVNTQNVGIFQEKEQLAQRLKQEDARKAELAKKYENLARFILTSKSVGAADGGPAAPEAAIQVRRRRSNSLDCLRDAKSLSLERLYGHLRKPPAPKAERCPECGLKDAMVSALQRQARSSAGAAEERDALRADLRRTADDNKRLQSELDSVSRKTSVLSQQVEENAKLQAQRAALEAAKERLEAEVAVALGELRAKEATLTAAQRAVEEKGKEVAAKQKDLRTFEERTRELQRQIEAQEHQNGELEDDLRGLCAENIAFQRYYELKKQGRHFKRVRKIFEKDRPDDYKPWMEYMPSEHTVDQTIVLRHAASQGRLNPTPAHRTSTAPTAAARSRSIV